MHVAVTPDGTRAYVTNFNSNTVSVINTATNTVTATIAVGANPDGVAITPNGATIYVANSGNGTGTNVSVINTASNTVTATVTVGSGPDGIAVTPNGANAYVTNSSFQFGLRHKYVNEYRERDHYSSCQQRTRKHCNLPRRKHGIRNECGDKYNFDY